MSVIHVENLGKRYRIGQRERYLALRDVLARAASAPARLFRARKPASSNGDPTHIWALKDVSFDVRQGEVVGIIGRNGAGKTTLLKILARVAKPTEGFAEVRGRMGSLLEVGTGFHPELTGRENVFLSGAILGMSKAEIQRKFDEMVAFAEVEKFIDTPVKHFSSGMQMRLAFAVAAHLEPEILLVDEVLAVGDLNFQKKCLGKMGDVARAGRTVIVVSHNMNAILTLCSRAVLLADGMMVQDGPAAEVTGRYFMEALGTSDASDLSNARRTGTGKARFSSLSVQALDPQGAAVPIAYTGCDVYLQVQIESRADLPESNVAVIIYDSSGYRLIDVNTAQRGCFVSMRAGQKACVSFHIRELLLKPGRYFVGLWLGRDWLEEIDNIERATQLDIAEGVETSKHVVVFPGPYLCRFVEDVTIQ
jgi:lipopolysaccharide transport system ATP-binding protein